jgi:hypothetical protein
MRKSKASISRIYEDMTNKILKIAYPLMNDITEEFDENLEREIDPELRIANEIDVIIS